MKTLKIDDNYRVVMRKEVTNIVGSKVVIRPKELSQMLWKLFLVKFAEENDQFDIPDNLKFDDFYFEDIRTATVWLKDRREGDTYDPNLCALFTTAIYLNGMDNNE